MLLKTQFIDGIRRWIYRSIPSMNWRNSYKKNYIDFPRNVRYNIGKWIGSGKPLSDYSIAAAAQHRSVFSTTYIAEKNKRYIESLPENEKKIRYKKSCEKGQITRKERHGSISESYRKGLILKGQRTALLLGITDTLSDTELLSLSGYQKKNNYQLLTESEKEKKRIAWKKQILKIPMCLKSSFQNIPFFQPSM